MFAIMVLIFIQVLFGINFITSKFSLMVMDPFTFSSIRFFTAGLVLFIVALVFKQVRKVNAYEFKLILICSLTGISMGQCLFMWGIKYSGAINASVVAISIPLFTLLISFLRNQVSLNRNKMIGIVGALIGVMILKSGDIIQWKADSLIGDVCLLAACFSLGLFISLSKDLYFQFPVIYGTSLNFLIGGVFLIPFGVNLEGINTEMLEQSPYWQAILFSIIGGTLATYFLNNWVIKKVDPVKLSLFIYLQPIVATVLAYIYLGETLTPFKILASLVIFVSVLYSLKETKEGQTN